MSDDASKTVVITNPQGLHARPAHAFVSKAKDFQSTITIRKGEDVVDGKSILEILTLAAVQGTELVVEAVGPDASQAVVTLGELLESLEDLPLEGT